MACRTSRGGCPMARRRGRAWASGRAPARSGGGGGGGTGRRRMWAVGARAWARRGWGRFMQAALRSLELVVRGRLDGLLHGNHLGLVPGPGTEPGEARPYQPGDDVRRMDWAITARTTEPHIRQTIADRELETWVAVDLSPSL